jgi:hypothetical protein
MLKITGMRERFALLPHSRDGILIVPFPSDRVIENPMHQIANLGPASVG